jgi:hypothetical protein
MGAGDGFVQSSQRRPFVTETFVVDALGSDLFFFFVLQTSSYLLISEIACVCHSRFPPQHQIRQH